MVSEGGEQHLEGVSVVIATLGGTTLQWTIESVNKGSVVPKEILICIPEEANFCPQFSLAPNVKIVPTATKGQVAQRAMGFRRAKCDLVLQLDDDMFVDTNCIERLVAIIQKEKKIAVGPALLDRATNASVYKQARLGTMAHTIYHWLMNGAKGYRPGEISKAGDAVGIDTEVVRVEQSEVEWLAGGCMMQRRENLILEDFYPYTGKAYCEDLIHSHHIRAQGTKLIVATTARCTFDLVSSADAGWRVFLRELYADFKARRYFMRLSGRGLARMYLFYAIRMVSYAVKVILR